MNGLFSSSGLRPVRRVGLAAVAVAAFLLLGATGAVAKDGAVPPPPANPTSADQIQNVDQVKTAIKAYYGDTLTTTPAPGDPTNTPLHQFSPTSAYAKEMAGIEADAEQYLANQAKNPGKGNHCKPTPISAAPTTKPPCPKPAIVLDVDDTTLNTYSYEIWTNFVYNPTTNANFVNAGSASVFPAVPGMPGLASQATAEGYTVFYLTGRPGTQRAATLANLQDAGYGPVPTGNLYMKDYGVDTWLAPCAQTCTTDQYKTLTRQYIESQGYDIVGNFGDQYSDLNGGFADRTFKIPNPMYFLP